MDLIFEDKLIPTDCSGIYTLQVLKWL